MIQADRLRKLPPYLFEQIDQKVQTAKSKGIDVISFGIGDPDLPTPPHIVDACIKAVQNPKNHRYPSSIGKVSFREAVAQRFESDFGVEVDPHSEITCLVGSKDGIHNIHLAYINPGDVVLYTNPGYPVYNISPGFCGGKPYAIPLGEDKSFLPDLDEVPRSIARKAKMIWLNYPNNPTTATADVAFYKEVMEFAEDYELMICSDEAYSYIFFDGERPVSFLEMEGAKERCIVFNSLSKTYNMTGWRIGYALGNSEFVSALVKLKGNVDSGTCQFIQDAATVALTSSQDCVKENNKIYETRRDVVISGLKKVGFEVNKPKATFYVWMKVPGGDSMNFTSSLLDQGIVVTPGIGFGEFGEGYVRLALTQPLERIYEALERIEKIA